MTASRPRSMASPADAAGADLAQAADLATPMAIRVAATLRIADHIVAGRTTVERIAPEVSVDAGLLERLMRHLVTAGILRGDSSSYRLTVTGAALADDHPSGLRRVLDIEGPLGRADLAFVRLLDAIRGAEDAFEGMYGRGFWNDLAADPRRQAEYDSLMATDVTAWADDIIPAYDWASLGSIIDVGGGDGSLLVALLRANPRLRGAVFERPATAGGARRTLERAGLEERGRVIEGDFFQAVPAEAEGYLLTAILHDWSDADAVSILRRCAQAACRGGRVFVIERTGAGGDAPSTQMDLRMLVYFGGRERTADEIVALAQKAGLRLVRVHPAGDLSVIELRRT